MPYSRAAFWPSSINWSSSFAVGFFDGTPSGGTSSPAVQATADVRPWRWLVGRPPGLYGMKEVLGL